MQSSVTTESVERATAQFWEQMLGMVLEPHVCGAGGCAGGACADYGSHRCELERMHVLGSCELAGVWAGRIEVRMGHGLASAATAAMLMQAVEEVQQADILDATKEIANMIAGTIKSALPRPCTMSVPYAEMEAAEIGPLTARAGALSVLFHHESGDLLVRVCPEAVDTSGYEAAPALVQAGFVPSWELASAQPA